MRVILREGEGTRCQEKDGYSEGEWFIGRRDNFERYVSGMSGRSRWG